MKHLLFKTSFMVFLLFPLFQSVSAQKWLDKLNKGLEKTNEVLEQINGTTNSTRTMNEQPTDSIDAKVFLNEAPVFEVKKLTMLDANGDTIRYEDGSIQYHYLVYDKDGNVCHPETAKKLTNSALKSGGIILAKLAAGAGGGWGLSKLSGLKDWQGILIGLGVAGISSINDIKNIRNKTAELKAYKLALEKYQATFTEEGLPRNAEVDLSDYTDCEELTQDALLVQAQIKESAAQGEGMSLEEIDMDKLDKLLDETGKELGMQREISLPLFWHGELAWIW